MKRLVIVTLFLGLFLHACQRSALDIDVIATVGGQRLTRSEFEDHLNTILGEEAYAAPSEIGRAHV